MPAADFGRSRQTRATGPVVNASCSRWAGNSSAPRRRPGSCLEICEVVGMAPFNHHIAEFGVVLRWLGPGEASSEIGRASCRERVERAVVGGALKDKRAKNKGESNTDTRE